MKPSIPTAFRRAAYLAPVLLVCAAVAAAQATHYNPGNGVTYVALPAATLPNARAAAASQGGHLLAINNAAEQSWVVSTFQSSLLAQSAWLGLSDETTEGVWRWDDGSPADYFNWAPGEPNNTGDQDYARLSLTLSGFPPSFVPRWYDVLPTALHLVIVELPPPAGDAPWAPVVVSTDGVYPYDTSAFLIPGPAPAWPCAGFFANPQDYWFRYDASLDGVVTVSNCPGSVAAPGGYTGIGTDTVVAVWTGETYALTQVACSDSSPGCIGQSETTFTAIAGESYYVQVALWAFAGGTVTGGLALKRFGAADDCAAPLRIYEGANGPFSNGGANDSPHAACVPVGGDVWFFLEVPAAGRLSVATTSGPVGLPNLADPVVQLYDGYGCQSVELTCADAAPGAPVVAATSLSHGPRNILIRVSGGDVGGLIARGWFGLNVDFVPRELRLTSSGGPGSFAVENVGGKPGSVYLTVFTLNAGGYPNGLFAGISPSAFEIFAQISSNAPPFVGALDASGASAWGVPAGAPSITLFAVTLFLTPEGYLDAATPPVQYLIP